MRRLILILALIPMLGMFSCTSQKKIVYFQGIDSAELNRVIQDYQVRIMPNDNLHITVSSINPDAAKMFNSITINQSVNDQSLNITGYLVDAQGYINFPVLGRIHLGGKTKTEAIEFMREKISQYIIDPVVNIRYINYKVTVLGEVVRPGTFTIQDERITLPEALGLAGDMTIYGMRNNVLVCRDNGGEKVFQRMDMTSPDIFSSEYFYLQQNDIVYVQPNRARAGSSSYNQNLTLGVSLLSLLVTIIAVFR